MNTSIYRAVGKMKGVGLGYILGFYPTTDKQVVLSKEKERGREWKEKEIEFIKCVNKI
jgi:hypothetical protein